MAGSDVKDVELIGVTKSYGSARGVENINLRVVHGEFYSLLGPSGCGKTTTLRLIAGFEQPDQGRVLIGGRDVASLPPYRRDVNTVFQHYALFPHMTVEENVAFGLQEKKVPAHELKRRTDEALEIVQLGALRERKPRQLSGGQQQRVALARALVNRPTVLLLDEPLGALDLKLRKEMQVELKALQQQVGITFVYVTHDQEEALTMSDRIAVMADGGIQQEGSPREIYEHPETRFVAEFIGMSNFFAGEVVAQEKDRVVVQTADALRVWCLSGGASTLGTTVTVAVRPEKIEISTAHPATAVNVWSGRVVAGTFLGEQTEYRVRIDDGREVVIRRQNLGLNGLNQQFALGAPVYLSWAPDVSLVLPRSA
ncbi:MAG TPA: ABC transporter ATP-binding protein [Candidatus Dormibacteraeota bacterium]